MHNQSNEGLQPDHQMSDVVEAEMVEVRQTQVLGQISKKPRLGQLIETLLDPKTLQTLMWCGSGLLVIGLVVWLWSMGLFKNPMVAAVSLGVGNLGVLSLGIGLVKLSRYRWAGSAIALLSCMVLPLNLWFYHSHGLIVMAKGGHLWIPAFAICLLYMAVAHVLKDSKFVYALTGGVVLTGMLFLADQSVNRFWEYALPSTFLVALGATWIHVERMFTTDEKSPFSRKTFGAAFFRSGQFVMMAGLALLFGGYLLSFAGVTDQTIKYFALGLTALASYTWAYCHMVLGYRTVELLGPQGVVVERQQSRGFLALSLGAAVWFVFIVVDLLALTFDLALVSKIVVGLMAIPYGLHFVANSSTILARREKLNLVSASTSAVLIAISIVSCFYWFESVEQVTGILAVFYGLNAILFSRIEKIEMALSCTAATIASIFLGFVTIEMAEYLPYAVLSFVGLVALLVGKASDPDNKLTHNHWYVIGISLLFVTGAGTTLMGFFRILTADLTWYLVALIGFQAVVSLVAMFVCVSSNSYTAFAGMTVVQTVLSAMSTIGLLEMKPIDQIEIFSIISGVCILIMSHVGWFRETERGDEYQDTVTIGLGLGTSLTIIPMIAGMIAFRFFGYEPSKLWTMFHNIGVLATGMMLLFSGLTCRLRSTTIGGAVTLTIYVVSLITLIHIPAAMQNIAVYMMVGGGIFFTTAVMLSIYRDRILALPAKIREGRGVFQVLKWR